MANLEYVLKWRGGARADRGTSDADATRIWLVGPFTTELEAAEWARQDQAEDGDDPRWQCVTISDEDLALQCLAQPFSYTLRVCSPSDASA